MAGGSVVLDRKGEGKGYSFSVRVVRNGNFAIMMLLDKALGDGKSQACALGFSGEKRFENVIQRRAVNSFAIVRNEDLDGIVRGILCPYGNNSLTIGAGGDSVHCI